MTDKRTDFIDWFNSLPPEERVEVWYECEAMTAVEYRACYERLLAKSEALLRCVEAAKPIVRWVADNFAEGIGDELDHWDLALDALRSGKD